jgi:hypothetical protein
MRMLSRIDNWLLDQFNRLAAWLQETRGLTMPVILQQACMSALVATVMTGVAMLILRGPLVGFMMLLLCGWSIQALSRALRRYLRDAGKDWNSDLARDYAARAIGATEGQRGIRELGILLSFMMLVVTIGAARLRPMDATDWMTALLWITTFAHLYLSCAEPKPPGSRRQQWQLALSTNR